jgi:glycosyltransferase involved in cell wall biosynthesis
VFLFPSMGHSRKGLKPFCQALAGMKLQRDLLVAVAGKPADGSWPFVRNLGYVDDMVSAYRAADFTALASLYEPFGLVGPESLACGTRVVFEDQMGCLPAIRPEYAFTFSVWDAGSIRKAVERAVAWARAGGHHFEKLTDGLRYDPSADAHAQALLQALK